MLNNTVDNCEQCRKHKLHSSVLFLSTLQQADDYLPCIQHLLHTYEMPTFGFDFYLSKAVMICGGNTGNAIPLEKSQGWVTSQRRSPQGKTKMGDAVVDHRDKNRQNKPAAGRYFLSQQLILIVAF